MDNVCNDCGMLLSPSSAVVNPQCSHCSFQPGLLSAFKHGRYYREVKVATAIELEYCDRMKLRLIQCSQLRLSGYADKSWCGRCATLMIMWLDRRCEITQETNLRIPVSVSRASGRSPPASILYPDNRNCEHWAHHPIPRLVSDCSRSSSDST